MAPTSTPRLRTRKRDLRSMNPSQPGAQKQPLIDRTHSSHSPSSAIAIPALSSLDNKRKHCGDDCPGAAKRRKKHTVRNSRNTQGRAAQGQKFPATQIFNKAQNSVCQVHKGKKRTQDAAFLGDSSGGGRSIAKRYKSVGCRLPLSEKNLKALEESIPEENMPSSSRVKLPSKASKRSRGTAPTEISPSSSVSIRAYSTTDPGFEKGLRELNFKSTSRETQPDEEDVARLLEVMGRVRNSPPPDSEDFYEILSFIESENEAMVVNEVTNKLIPFRHTSRNNSKTRHLLYRLDRPWKQWGSPLPGILPQPQPDCCITLRNSGFTQDEQKHMVSPYKDGAGFYPVFICEVKTALQGPQIANMQNANNAITTLRADFELQRRIGQDRQNQRKIRLITTAHNTRTQWYTVWFYILGETGKPEWYSKLIKEISFRIPEENGFETLRRYNLNLQEYLNVHTLSQLKADLAKASQLGLQEMSQLERENQVNTPPLTESDPPPGIPAVGGDDSEAHSPADYKRIRVSTDSTRTAHVRTGTRSGRKYLKDG